MTASCRPAKPRVLERHFDDAGSTNLLLTSDEIHIWQRQLRCDRKIVQNLTAFLDSDEMTRAARFRMPSSREEYVVSRGTLRWLLGGYLNCSPSELRFTYSQYGRPQLDASQLGKHVQFNISHSGDVVVLAFASGRRIGVDVEQVRKDFGTSEIAERFFSAAEREALRQVPLEQRHEAFFMCWTRKEAFIKALGEGLSHPLDQFDVSLAPGLPPALLATRPDTAEGVRWCLWDIDVPSGYAGALAAEIFPE